MLRSGAHAGLVFKDLGLLNGPLRQELVAAGLHKISHKYLHAEVA